MEVVPDVPALRGALLDKSAPIAKRMRAVFYLRTKGGADAEEALRAGECPGSRCGVCGRGARAPLAPCAG